VEFVHTLEAGLVALSPDGRIIAANRQARFFLHDLPVTPGQSFDMIFSIPYERFMAQARIQNAGRLTDQRGSTYYVLASNLPRSEHSVPGIRFPDRSNQGTGKTQPQFVCEDTVVRQAIEIVENAVHWHVPILIRGETGTGKELLARHIHTANQPESLQANLVMPEPCPFLSKRFPICSIIRPTNTKGAAAGAVRALSADGLFIGQNNQAFFDLVQDLAADADAARRDED